MAATPSLLQPACTAMLLPKIIATLVQPFDILVRSLQHTDPGSLTFSIVYIILKCTHVVGNAPTLLSLADLQKMAPTWMNTSMDIFNDPQANKVTLCTIHSLVTCMPLSIRGCISPTNSCCMQLLLIITASSLSRSRCTHGFCVQHCTVDHGR